MFLHGREISFPVMEMWRSGIAMLSCLVEVPADCMADKDYAVTPDGFLLANHLASLIRGFCLRYCSPRNGGLYCELASTVWVTVACGRLPNEHKDHHIAS